MKFHRGTYRWVLLLGRWAIKVPRPARLRGGLWCNREEMRVWELTKHALLCPVVSCGLRGAWLIMERAETLPPAGSVAIRVARLEMITKYQRDTGLEAPDNKHENLGYLDGRMVVVDYAGFPPWVRAEQGI